MLDETTDADEDSRFWLEILSDSLMAIAVWNIRQEARGGHGGRLSDHWSMARQHLGSKWRLTALVGESVCE